jgi:four helix bundle protein
VGEGPVFSMGRELASAEQVEWELKCSRAVTSDVIWKLDAYRSALFLLDVARTDARADARAAFATRPEEGIAAQLIRAAGSVSANIGEGYSRSTRADRLRFLGYALGSARECMSWYHALTDALPRPTLDSRLLLLSRIRALLLGLIRSLRAKSAPHHEFEG